MSQNIKIINEEIRSYQVRLDIEKEMLATQYTKFLLPILIRMNQLSGKGLPGALKLKQRKLLFDPDTSSFTQPGSYDWIIEQANDFFAQFQCRRGRNPFGSIPNRSGDRNHMLLK
jgi:hypothetical protein